jgi:hypothetical protein
VTNTSAPLGREDLRKQYDAVLLEYRFQLQLNWDRAKHYLVFNTATLGAAVALYRDAKTWVPEAAVSALLALAAFNSYAGQAAVASGHEYYRRIRANKTRLEKALGLEEYAIDSTPGMRRDHDAATAGTPEAGQGRGGKITGNIRRLLWAIAAVCALGSVYALQIALRHLWMRN